jgi:hypothetical protein
MYGNPGPKVLKEGIASYGAHPFPLLGCPHLSVQGWIDTLLLTFLDFCFCQSTYIKVARAPFTASA